MHPLPEIAESIRLALLGNPDLAVIVAQVGVLAGLSVVVRLATQRNTLRR